jgi:hypothetical protein
MMPDLETWRRRRAARARLLSAALACALLLPEPSLAARRQKTVFRSQPTEWDPEPGRDGAPRAIAFEASWTFEGFGAPIAGDPVVSGRLLVAAGQDGEVVALDPADGRVAWRSALAGPLGVGPAADASRIYLSTRGGRLLALNAGDGRALWTTEVGSEPAAAPRILGARLLVVLASGEILALDATDGRIEARRALPGRPSTAPEAAPGTIIVGTEDGSILALDERTLEDRWRHRAGHAISAPPVFHQGRVYVAAADRTLRCLRFRDGRPRWITRTGGLTTSRPILRGRDLYVLCYDNDVYVMRHRNGHLMSRVRLGHRLDADSATLDQHLLVVPFTEGSLIGLALPGLQAVGRFDLNIPGEWFTTSPVVADGRVALGYGRSAGRVLALRITERDGAPGPIEAAETREDVP